MIEPARRLSVFSAFLMAALIVLTAGLAPAGSAHAQGLYQQTRYAAIVVDANSGEVLYARRADALRYPASITKVMTLYLTFEALATGRMSANDMVVFSSHAAVQAPTKIGLRSGEAMTVDQAIKAVTTKSANDVAVALAEKIGGTEARFAALMTLRAQELGMTNTRFVNASGLPDNRQITTARDIAILSRAVMRDYPQYYFYFGVKSFEFRGQTIANHNSLLRKMPGVDGLKTGYTNASGYNLAASAVRDGRRLITVVLGGASTAARDENVAELLNAGFDVMTKRKLGQNITIAANMLEPEDIDGPVMRPSVEQGSADQAGLQIALVDANLRGIQNASYAARAVAPENWSAGSIVRSTENIDQAGLKRLADCRKVTRTKLVKTGKGRRAKVRKVAYTTSVCLSEVAVPVAARGDIARNDIAKADCVKTKVGKGRKARTRTVCKPVTEAKAQVEKTSAKTNCVKVGKGKKRRTVCKEAQVASAKPEAAEKDVARSDSGRYVIQVGAFTTRDDAQDHLSKITRKYGGAVAAGDGAVQAAGKGTFRARFSGFSAKEAKAACKTLSAKGERCMVLSGS